MFAVKDYLYDSAGLLSQGSLPYFASSTARCSATSTAALFTSYGYDALKRGAMFHRERRRHDDLHVRAVEIPFVYNANQLYRLTRIGNTSGGVQIFRTRTTATEIFSRSPTHPRRRPTTALPIPMTI